MVGLDVAAGAASVSLQAHCVVAIVCVIIAVDVVVSCWWSCW